MTTLADLIDTLIATEHYPTSWVWHGDDGGEGAYLDCSQMPSSAPGEFQLELGDGDDAVCIDVTIDDLREIHRKLTLALAVATRTEAADRAAWRNGD
jgi:hypothetical protein